MLLTIAIVFLVFLLSPFVVAMFMVLLRTVQGRKIGWALTGPACRDRGRHVPGGPVRSNADQALEVTWRPLRAATSQEGQQRSSDPS